MYIRSLEDLIFVLTAQAANIATYQTEVGATAGDITAISDELENAEAIKAFAESVATDRSTVVQLKESFAKGPGPIGAVPVFQVFTWPNPPSPGAIPFANQRNRRFNNSPTITGEARAALLLDDGPPEPFDPPKPVGEAHAAQSGYAAAVVVSNRKGSDRWVLRGRTSSSEPWQTIDSFTDKSGNITRPSTSNEPYVLELQIQLMKKDEPYGPPSDTFYATLNP